MQTVAIILYNKLISKHPHTHTIQACIHTSHTLGTSLRSYVCPSVSKKKHARDKGGGYKTPLAHLEATGDAASEQGSVDYRQGGSRFSDSRELGGPPTSTVSAKHDEPCDPTTWEQEQ